MRAVIGGLALVGILAGCSSGGGMSGQGLADAVTRTAKDNGGNLSNVTCPAPHVAKGSITDCRGTSDGEDIGIRVTWDDDQGHFTLEKESLPPAG